MKWLTTMKHSALVLTFAVAGGVLMAAGPGPIRAPETPIEAHLNAVRLPEQADGPVLVTPCAGCATRSLTLAPGALLQWNGSVIEYNKLRERSRVRKPGTITLILKRDTGQIVRMIGHD